MYYNRYMPKTALITGATGGIGYEFADICASKGINLVLVGRNESKLEKIASDFVKKYTVSVTKVTADLSDPDSPQTVYDAVQKEELTIDYLINNAGFGDFGMFTETDWAKEQAMMQVNMTTLVQLTKLFLPKMINNGSGAVMNLASTAAFQPGPLMAVYYATKSFVLSFSEAIGYELKGTGVTVTALCPGPTRSGFQKHSNIEESKLVKDKKLPTAREVAEFGVEAMLEGKPVAIHGLNNWFLAKIVPFLPRQMVLDTVYNMQQK
jgi:hypothetical protein